MKTKKTPAARFAELERSAINEALDETLQHASQLGLGWTNFIGADAENNLEHFPRARGHEAVAAAIERDTVMHRAKQIAGVLMMEAMYSLRDQVGAQLEREFSTPAGKEIARIIREFDPDRHWVR